MKLFVVQASNFADVENAVGKGCVFKRGNELLAQLDSYTITKQ